ncbi:hypothetical protein CsatB_013029 [Cannabis sativa]
MSSLSQEVLKHNLTDVGRRLLTISGSITDLLNLIERAENLLSNVEQTELVSLEVVISPALTALISDELFKHSDTDVKLSVLTCITEIIRITAPDPPYKDEQMKEIFKSTVVAFEYLSLESGRRFTKAMHILDVVCKIRSCLLMMDLGCDALVYEMFRIFFEQIRSNHPPSIFSSMEQIMTLVLEESEDIPSDIFTLLLSSVNKKKQNISSACLKLGETVFTMCASKLKPYIKTAVTSMKIDVNDYAPIVATLCPKTNNHKAAKETEKTSQGANGGNADQKGDSLRALMPPPRWPTSDNNGKHNSCKELHTERAADSSDVAEPSSILNKSAEEPSNSLMSAVEGNSKGADSSGTAEHESEPVQTSRKNPKDIAKGKEPVSVEEDTDTAPKKRGQKSNTSMDAEEAPGEREDSRNTSREEKKETDSVMKSTKAAKSENEPTSATKKRGQSSNSSSIKSEEGDDHAGRSSRLRNTDNGKGNVTELAPQLDKSKRKNVAQYQRSRGKGKMSTLNQEADTKSQTDIKEKAKVIVNLNLNEKPEDTGSVEENDQENSTKLELAAASEGPRQSPEEKQQEQSTVKSEDVNVNDNLSALRTTRKRRRAVHYSNNDTNEGSLHKGWGSRTGTKFSSSSKTTFKKEHVIGKEEASEMPNLGELLIGTKIKVWWPLDKEFYEGIVKSYDPVKKKHQVLYVDGDQETLNLQHQRWEPIVDDALAEEGKKTDLPGPDSSSQINSLEAVTPVQVKPDQADDFSDEGIPKGRLRRTKSVYRKQEKSSDRAKAVSSSGRNSGRKKSKREKQAETSDQAKANSSLKRSSGRKVENTKGPSREKEAKTSDQAKADPSPKRNSGQKVQAKSNQEKKAKISDPPKADPTPERNSGLKVQSKKSNSNLEKQAKKSDQSKADPPSGRQGTRAQKRASEEPNEVKKSDQGKTDSFLETLACLRKRVKKSANSDKGKQPKGSHSKADSSSKRTEMPTSAADAPLLDNPVEAVVDEKLKDNDSNSGAVVDTKITEEMAESIEKKNPKVDNENGASKV